jgi:8-amino-7-oxononanoate synthase
MNSDHNPEFITESLRRRADEGAERTLAVSATGIDLCSNDYLGIARGLGSPEVFERVRRSLPAEGALGATGSRLVSGTTEAHVDLESYLSEFYSAEAALVFGSGYEANVGLLSSIGRRSDTILYDELVHASMRDGIRLGVSRAYSFAHNDLDDLRSKLSQARGDVYVAVEAVYSMDGHMAPLAEIASICRESGAYLIVDEAHSSGVYGQFGEGLCVERGLVEQIFARVHTFGKAVGFRGACVVGSDELRRFLINFSRPFIYSTAPDRVALAFMKEAHQMIRTANHRREELFSILRALKSLKQEFSELSFTESDTCIQALVVPGNRAVLAVEKALQDAGFFTKAIRSPTVPEGSERIRFSVHSFNSIAELRGAFEVVRHLNRVRSAV